MSAKKPLRIGIVGANWGENHIGAWRRVPDTEVVAICTSRRESAQAMAAKHNIPKAFWDAGELCRSSEIDVIDITPRPSIRVPIARDALEQGLHVLQPLPFADTFENASELARLAQSSGRIAMIENLHRYSPTFNQLKQLVQDNQFGEICTIQVSLRTNILVNPPPNYVYEWITQEGNGSSVLRNYGAHVLHMMSWMFGDAERVACSNRIVLKDLRFSDGSTKPNRTEDTSVMMLQLPSGVCASVDLCWCSPAAEGLRIEIVGTDGRATLTADRLGPQNAVLRVADRHNSELMVVSTPESFRREPDTELDERMLGSNRDYPLSVMCHRMAKAVERGDLLSDGPSFAEGLKVMQVIEAAYEASTTGNWVQISR